MLWHSEAAVQAGIPFSHSGVLSVGTARVLQMFSWLNWTGRAVFCALCMFLQ